MKKLLLILYIIQWNILYSADGAAQKVSPELQALIEQKKEEAAARGGSLLQRSDRVGGPDGLSNIVEDIRADGQDPERLFLEVRSLIEGAKSINYSSVQHDSKSELEVVGRRWK